MRGRWSEGMRGRQSEGDEEGGVTGMKKVE